MLDFWLDAGKVLLDPCIIVPVLTSFTMFRFDALLSNGLAPPSKRMNKIRSVITKLGVRITG